MKDGRKKHAKLTLQVCLDTLQTSKADLWCLKVKGPSATQSASWSSLEAFAASLWLDSAREHSLAHTDPQLESTQFKKRTCTLHFYKTKAYT